MGDIILLIISFPATVILQAFVSMLLVRLGKSPWVSLVVFPAGLFVHLYFLVTGFPALWGHEGVALPMTSAAIFIAGSLLCLLWFTIAAGGLVSPSGRILVMLLKRGALPRTKLLASVTEDELLTRRITRLVQKGLVLRRGDVLFLTTKGKRLLSITRLAGNVLGYHELPVGGWSWT